MIRYYGLQLILNAPRALWYTRGKYPNILWELVRDPRPLLETGLDNFNNDGPQVKASKFLFPAKTPQIPSLDLYFHFFC